MQAIILAAGTGKRLRPLTNDKPKCLLKLADKEIIWHQVEMLRSNSIREIVIVTGYKTEMIENEFKNEKDILIQFNPFYKSTNVIGSMWFGMKYLKETFIFLHGDTIFEETILKDTIDGDGDIILAVDLKKCDEEDMKVSLMNDKIVKISKEIDINQSDGEFIGLAKISKNVIRDLNEIVDDYMLKEDFNQFFEVAIQDIIDNHNKYNVNYIRTQERFWCEIDFIEEYNRAKKYFDTWSDFSP